MQIFQCFSGKRKGSVEWHADCSRMLACQNGMDISMGGMSRMKCTFAYYLRIDNQLGEFSKFVHRTDVKVYTVSWLAWRRAPAFHQDMCGDGLEPTARHVTCCGLLAETARLSFSILTSNSGTKKERKRNRCVIKFVVVIDARLHI